MSLQPTFEVFQGLVETAKESGANTFVVQKIILADVLTPQTAYLRIARPGSKDATRSFLLESATRNQLSRYSFIGSDPKLVISTDSETGKDPIELLEKELNKYTPVAQTTPLPPFKGGAVGYVSYDCIKYFEPRTKRDLEDPLKIPEAVLMLCDTVVAFDNVFQRIHVIHNIHASDLSNFDAEKAYNEAQDIIDATIDKLLGPAYEVYQKPVQVNNNYESNVGQKGYEDHVKALKDYILKGDIIQAVPSQRVTHPTDLHPWNIYRHLRTLNPSPYLFYLDLIDLQIIGASPELLVKIDDDRVVTHPIAGTVKRGATPEEDDKLSQQLLNSVKDRAEHVMLVDLARNDINRVCKPESSSVDFFMNVERFSHVIHLVSQCSGELREDKTRFDAFRSIFPAGTVSGAPKVRAMELISEREKVVRGVYAGAVGHWGYGKNEMDTCIALRTMLYKDDTVYLQAGGGIVYDSDPYEEFIETENKMKANMLCLREAEELWSKKTTESE